MTDVFDGGCIVLALVSMLLVCVTYESYVKMLLFLSLTLVFITAHQMAMGFDEKVHGVEDSVVKNEGV